MSIKLVIAVILCSATALSASPVLAANDYPSQIIDLTNWKQTLPTGSSKSPTEIKVDKLSTFISNPYFQLNSKKDGVQFRAPVNGVTTSGSGYPRSELREMTNGGKSLANWSTSSGAHMMYIDQAITVVPKKKKHVVAGQIHDSEDDVIVIRLEYPKLFVDINGKQGPVLDSNYVLGKRFNVKFLAENGQIKVFYNGGSSPAYVLNKKTSGNYFKAGAYTQSNCSKESECSDKNYGEVNIYDLVVKHGKTYADVSMSEKVAVAKSEMPVETETKAAVAVEASPSAPVEGIAVAVAQENSNFEVANVPVENPGKIKVFFQWIVNPFMNIFQAISQIGGWRGNNA